MKKIAIIGVFLVLWLPVTGQAGSGKKSVSVTVYSNNLALVEEIRPVLPTGGETLVRWENVPTQIDPTSVHLHWLGGYRNAILEQNFEYDLVNVRKLFRKYIDQTVQLKLKDQSTLSGRLLSAGESVILETQDKSIVSVRNDEIVQYTFRELPEGLITRPTLIWTLEKPVTKKQLMQVEYLTSGMSWHAEYVGVLSGKGNRLDVSGWASLENHSGAAFAGAALKLVAGQPHRVSGRRPMAYENRLMKTTVQAAVPRFSERAAFEYHLYNLKGKTTLKQNETKQIPLFGSKQVKFQKIYKFDGARWGKVVKVFLRFRNTKTEGIGQPLPAGKFRIYQKDGPRSSIFLGEDWIDHTPKGEMVTLNVGNAFDIRGTRTQTRVKRVAKRVREESYLMEIRNFKDQPVTVDVIEHLNYRAPQSQWTIRKSSRKFEKKDARTIIFHVKVGSHNAAKVTYTVRYEW
ncbi:MAG: DUF4139 domain-containing protein [Calditrichaeota bacterium]|nr:DUF4139 domain-containing protein [Calditrichota bacterium]